MQDIVNHPETMLPIGALILVGVLIGMILTLIVVKRGFLSIVEQIKQSVVPRSLDLTPQTEDIADMAVELWRFERRLAKIRERLTEDENKALSNSVDRLRRFVQKNDIEVSDYSGQMYNEGMNLDILSSEKDPELKQSVIYETHQPAIVHKGILIRKSKVIIHEK